MQIHASSLSAECVIRSFVSFIARLLVRFQYDSHVQNVKIAQRDYILTRVFPGRYNRPTDAFKTVLSTAPQNNDGRTFGLFVIEGPVKELQRQPRAVVWTCG